MSMLEAAPLRAGDPRAGLRHRYNMEEILAINGGKPKIQGLNYDALTMLRNPLYVKFAQELRDKSAEVNGAIRQRQTEDIALRQMATEQGLPHDELKQVIERVPEQGEEDEFMEESESEDEDMRPEKAAEDTIQKRYRDEDDDDDNDTFPPGDGGSRDFTPQAGAASTKSPVREEIQTELERWRRRPRASERADFQTVAEIEELRRELRQQQKQQIIIQNLPPPPTTPMKEIIREIHQIREVAPPPVAPRPSEETAGLIAALSQAVAQNQNLVAFAQRMGMNMDQLVALMRAQLRGAGTEVAASSSSTQPPPPPPPLVLGSNDLFKSIKLNFLVII